MGIYCVFLLHFVLISKIQICQPLLSKKILYPSLPRLLGIYKETWNIIIIFFCIYLVLNSIFIFIFICFVFAQRPEQSIWWYWYKNWHVPSSHHNSSCGFYNGFCVWLEAYSCYHCHQSIVDDRGWYYGKGMFFSMQWCVLPLHVPAQSFEVPKLRKDVLSLNCSYTVQMQLNRREKFSYWHLWFDDQKC